MNFEKIAMKDEDAVPESYNTGQYDYTPLIKAAKGLTPGKVLTIPLEKDHQVQNIRSALSRLDKTRKYRVYGRSINGQKNAIVKLAAGHK